MASSRLGDQGLGMLGSGRRAGQALWVDGSCGRFYSIKSWSKLPFLKTQCMLSLLWR